jgi:hypothetical protein
MRSQEAVERAIARLGLTGAAAGGARERLSVRMNDALNELGHQSALLPEAMAELLRKNFTVALVAGSADLTTHTSAAEPMLPEQIVKVTFPGLEHEMQRMPDEESLNMPWPSVWAYYAIFNNTMGTRNTDGNRTTLEGNATVRASYVPTIDHVPSQLAPLLIQILAGYEAPAEAPTKKHGD